MLDIKTRNTEPTSPGKHADCGGGRGGNSPADPDVVAKTPKTGKVPCPPVDELTPDVVVIDALPADPDADGGPTAPTTALDDLITAAAAFAARELACAVLPTASSSLPFFSNIQMLKEMAWNLAAKDPFVHLTQADIDARFRDAGRDLFRAADAAANRLPDALYAAIGEVARVSTNGVVRPPEPWRSRLGDVIFDELSTYHPNPDFVRFDPDAEYECCDDGGELIADTQRAFVISYELLRAVCDAEQEGSGKDDFRVLGKGDFDILTAECKTYAEQFDTGDAFPTQPLMVGQPFKPIHTFFSRRRLVRRGTERVVPFNLTFLPAEEDTFNSGEIRAGLDALVELVQKGLSFSQMGAGSALANVPLTPGSAGGGIGGFFQQLLLFLPNLLLDAFSALAAPFVNTTLNLKNDVFTPVLVAGTIKLTANDPGAVATFTANVGSQATKTPGKPMTVMSGQTVPFLAKVLEVPVAKDGARYTLTFGVSIKEELQLEPI